MYAPTDLTAALAAEHRQRLLTEAAEHRRATSAARAARRHRQLRLRLTWTAAAVPVPCGGDAA